MTDIQPELAFSDVVKMLMKAHGIGYAKAAQLLDKAIEPQLVAQRSRICREILSLAEKKCPDVNTGGRERIYNALTDDGQRWYDRSQNDTNERWRKAIEEVERNG